MLIDQSTREVVASSVTQSTLVEAGAGTGKTTLIVERIYQTVRGENPIPLSRIVAITFTELAATELRDRLRRKFQSDSATPVLSREALAHLDSARIGTIHSFAYQILRENSLALNLPPSLTLLTDFQKDKMFDEWWANNVLLSSDAATTQMLNAGNDFGLSPNHLMKLSRAILENKEELLKFGNPSNLKIIATEFLSTLQTCVTLFPQPCLYEKLLSVQQFVEAYQLSEKSFVNPQSLLKLAKIANELSTSLGNQKEAQAAGIGKTQFSSLKEIVKKLITLARALLRAEFESKYEAFIPLLFQYHRALLDQGLISYDDQLRLTEKLLQDPQILANVSQSIKALFVDEFQDTDPVQFSIITKIANHSQCPVMFVGDPKQAIYGFRDASVEIMEELKLQCQPAKQNHPSSLNQPISHHQITTNFRSHPDIIQWVNDRFTQFFKENRAESIQQVEYVPLAAKPIETEASNTPHVYRLTPNGTKAAPIRVNQAELIVNAIQTLVAKEQRNFGEIAILYPKRTELGILINRLQESDIPFQIESQISVFESEAVHELLAILKALNNPEDEPALIGALRSILIACSDQDLYDHVQTGGKWRINQGSRIENVQAGFDVLIALKQLVSLNSIAGLVHQILLKLYAYEITESIPKEAKRLLEYQGFLTFIREYEESEPPSLRRFLDYCDAIIESGKRQEVQVNPEAQLGAVKLMTVHAAKGLEFPIVFAIGLESKASSKTLWVEPYTTGNNQERRYEYSINKEKASEGSAEIQALRTLKEKYESERLLYVAATRAKEILIVSLPMAGLAERFIAESGLNEASPMTEFVPVDKASWQKRTGEVAKATEPKLLKISAPTQMPSVAATTIAKDREAPDMDEETLIPKAHFAGGGAKVGKAVHAALQRLPIRKLLQNQTEMEAKIHQICASESNRQGLNDEAQIRVQKCVTKAILAPELAQTLTCPYLREVPCSVKIGEKVIQCIIDLMILHEDNSISILDYKTDSVASQHDVEAKMNRYRIQAGCYALALQTATQKTIRNCTFLFVGGTSEETKSAIPFTITKDNLNEVTELARHSVDVYSWDAIKD